MKYFMQYAAVLTLALTASSLPAPSLRAQSPPAVPATAPTVDHFSQKELLEKAEQLKPGALAGNGQAGARLAEYPNHFTMISLREKSGGAEIHEQYADIFCVLKGQAMLVTGGTVIDPKTLKPGEIAGSALTGGTPVELKEGDFVHIPAGVSHQLLLPKGGEFVYFVIKVKEL